MMSTLAPSMVETISSLPIEVKDLAKIETRYTRQENIIPNKTLADASIAVIGCGAIGRQVAIQAGCMGFGRITLFDSDTVDLVNLAPQGFPSKDIGESKVYSVAHSIREQNEDPIVTVYTSKFSKSLANYPWGNGKNIAFLCVDSITARKNIYEMLQSTCVNWIIDGRMSSEAFRIITVRKDDPYYETTLFAQSEAFRGSCTAKSTIYCACTIAGKMLSSARKILTNFEPTKDMEENLFADELTIIRS